MKYLVPVSIYVAGLVEIETDGDNVAALIVADPHRSDAAHVFPVGSATQPSEPEAVELASTAQLHLLNFARDAMAKVVATHSRPDVKTFAQEKPGAVQ